MLKFRVGALLLMAMILCAAQAQGVHAQDAAAATTEELRALRLLLEKMDGRLEAIEKRLAEMDAQEALGNLQNRFADDDFIEVKADPEVLAKIKLPDEPTKDEVRDYVRAIARASKRQNSFSSDDIQVAMLQRVGPEHLDVLLEAGQENYHVGYAIAALIGPQHKELILAHLVQNPQLIEEVERMNWTDDAKPILYSELKHPRGLPAQWITAVASYKDPSTYDDLKRAFVGSDNPAEVYHAIEYLPDFDLAGAVEEAWMAARREAHWGRTSMAGIAVQFGHADALEALVTALAADVWEAENARKAMLMHTQAVGTNEQIIQWYRDNRPLLRFDAHRKLWIVVPLAG